MRPSNPYDRKRRLILFSLSLLVPAAAIVVWRDAWWPAAVFALWSAAAAGAVLAGEQRRHREQIGRMLEHARHSALRMLSHHRHDWMNDLQILYGYIRLNKPDKAADIVDRIRERMENDSRVSQLGNAELAMFLLSFRTMCDHMRLDVRIADGLQLDRLPVDGGKLAACVIGLINAFRYRSAGPVSGENVLRVSLSRTDRALILELAYEGGWASGNGLAEDAARLLDGIGHLTEEETERQPGSARRMAVAFPLTA